MDIPCPVYIYHWWQWHPPIGTFIGILALLGVLVPLFIEWGKDPAARKSLLDDSDVRIGLPGASRSVS
jgi:hypothetical protein